MTAPLSFPALPGIEAVRADNLIGYHRSLFGEKTVWKGSDVC